MNNLNFQVTSAIHHLMTPLELKHYFGTENKDKGNKKFSENERLKTEKNHLRLSPVCQFCSDLRCLIALPNYKWERKSLAKDQIAQIFTFVFSSEILLGWQQKT